MLIYSRFLSPPIIAKKLNLHVNTIRMWCKRAVDDNEDFIVCTVSKRYLIPKNRLEDLLKYIENKKKSNQYN